MVSIRRIDSEPCQLGENTYWNLADGRFYFCDIMGGTIFSFAQDETEARLELKTPYQIGAFEFSRNGNLVLFTEKGLCLAGRDGDGVFRLHDDIWIPFDFIEGERFNDAIVDARGRILTGSKRADNRDGRLFSIESDGTVRVLLDGLKISNGMGFSPDGRRFYHTESVDKVIRCFDYDPMTGDISDGHVLVDSFPVGGEPDGMTVDEDGNIWTACWGSGTVCGYNPEGRLLKEVKLPTRYISCVTFGGDKMDRMVVSSATCCVDEIEENDGRCYIVEGLGSKGRIENLIG